MVSLIYNYALVINVFIKGFLSGSTFNIIPTKMLILTQRSEPATQVMTAYCGHMINTLL